MAAPSVLTVGPWVSYLTLLNSLFPPANPGEWQPSATQAVLMPSVCSNKSYTCRSTVALVTIAKTWKGLKCPSADDWINKMQSIHTVEYYIAIKMSGAVTHAT